MPPKTTRTDEFWMRQALNLAYRGLGRVAPNPSVGCILVKDSIIIGRGVTADGGRPHAETIAIAEAGSKTKGATAYVTLEPCAHDGETPPCADALIDASISRLVVAVLDSDHRVNGKGIKRIKGADIQVTCGVLEAEAKKLNEGFFLSKNEQRPLVTLKMATSIDGNIALKSGESHWITGPLSRRYGHMMRARHDAILVGVNTVLRDNPSLTCRINGLEALSPQRIILDTQLRTPLDSILVQTANQVSTSIYTQSNDKIRIARYQAYGVHVINLRDIKDLRVFLSSLAAKGITRLLVEGGAKMHTAFLNAELVDEIAHFKADCLIGADGKTVVSDLSIQAMTDMKRFNLSSVRRFGSDILASYTKSE